MSNFLDNIELKKARTLITGKAKVKVVGVNPDKAELAKILGIDDAKLTKDPVYDGFITVYVKNDQHNTVSKGTFWLSNEFVKESAKGKTKYINAYAQSAYLANPEDDSELDWYSRTGLRKAKEGEDELYQLFVNWIGIDTSGGKLELPFDDFVKGDLSDFYKAIGLYGDKEFIVLMGVAAGKYQEFYTRDFGRTMAKTFKGIQWNKEHTIEFQEYVSSPEPDPLESEADNADLPF
jgi:hypothetical protein